MKRNYDDNNDSDNEDVDGDKNEKDGDNDEVSDGDIMSIDEEDLVQTSPAVAVAFTLSSTSVASLPKRKEDDMQDEEVDEGEGEEEEVEEEEEDNEAGETEDEGEEKEKEFVAQSRAKINNYKNKNNNDNDDDDDNDNESYEDSDLKGQENNVDLDVGEWDEDRHLSSRHSIAISNTSTDRKMLGGNFSENIPACVASQMPRVEYEADCYICGLSRDSFTNSQGQSYPLYLPICLFIDSFIYLFFHSL